jgi:hypothetical protein
MGSRGAFIDLESFDFVEGGQHYHKIGGFWHDSEKSCHLN